MILNSIKNSSKLLLLSLNLTTKRTITTTNSNMTSSISRSKWNPTLTPYPITRRDESFSESFKSIEKGSSVEVKDPYHYLAEPPSTSEETKAFVEAQGNFTRQYLDTNKLNTEKYKNQLTANWDYAKFSCPALKGDGNYYFTYNSGLQAQSSIYRFPKSEVNSPIKDGEPGGELFFDPNLLSEDGSISRSSSSFSEDGKYFAYSLSQSGSDWTTIYVRPSSVPHVSTQTIGKDEGRLEKDVLRFVKFSSIGWTKDSLGFFYQRFPERKEHDTEGAAGTETDSDQNAMIYYHKLHTSQSEDILVMKDDNNPGWMFGAGATEDGRYVTMSFSKDTGRSNLLWIADLQECEIGANMKWKKVVNEWGEYYAEMANDGSKFYFYTNANDSPNYKIVTYDLNHPELGFVDLVAHRPEALLSSYHLTNTNSLLLVYSIDVKDELYLHDLVTGKKIKRLAENLTGSLDQISGRREDSEFWYSVSGFTTPGTVLRYQFTEEGKIIEGNEGKESVYRVAKVKGIDPKDFISEQVFYTSKDGTKIPMFITRPVGVEINGDNPAILYGYGGFSASMTPFFSPSLLTWIKHYKGILAVANIRGGGEYGESWHLAGVKEKKQNVFDDFQFAAKYLISEGYAGKDKVAISGGSNGGLLVAACVNQAPELFSAVIADVGVLDMLRFQRYTVGKFWVSDYGSADEDGFDYLIKYSPLHTINPNKVYPPCLFLTGDHDDRVVPLHTFKHVAEMQYQLKNNPNPLLIRVDSKSGHGAGKSTEKKIEEACDKYGFVAMAMDLKFYD